jgi:hypothetical protein
METQAFTGRDQLLQRLTAQVGDEGLARSILIDRGHMTADGKLTAAGYARSMMTAEERAIDRAVKRSGRSHSDYVYNPDTNRATVKATRQSGHRK